ncbi:MAG: inositol monophosphatase [Patescibacteria group bacterium]
MDSEYKKVALELAKEAGEIMRKNFMMGMKKEWKEDHSPVTETDTAINEIVVKKITEHFPTHSILSEEAEDILQKSEYAWICDPVDGTHNFAHGIPTSAFALALVQDGIPILGVICDPFLNRIYFAEKGKGATLNGETIKVSASPSVQKTVIGIGKWSAGVINLFPVGEALRERGVRLVTGLSIDYMGALVGAGEFSAILFGGKDPHDTAAIQIIVEEAGGKATDLFGQNTRYDQKVAGQLASNGLVHDEILEVIKKYGIKV